MTSTNPRRVRFAGEDKATTDILDSLLSAARTEGSPSHSPDRSALGVSPIDPSKVAKRSEDASAPNQVEDPEWKRTFTDNSNRLLKESQRQIQDLLHFKRAYEKEVERSEELQKQVYAATESAAQWRLAQQFNHNKNEKRIEKLEAALEESRSRENELRTELSLNRVRMTELQEKNNLAGKEVHQLQLEVNSRKNEVASLRRKLEEGSREAVKLESKNLKLEAQLFELQRKLKKKNVEEISAVSLGEDTEELGSSLEHSSGVWNTAEGLRDMQAYFIKLKSNLTRNDEHIVDIERQLEESLLENQRLQRCLAGVESENEALCGELNLIKIANEKKEIEAECETSDLQNQLEKTLAELDFSNAAQERTRQELSKLNLEKEKFVGSCLEVANECFQLCLHMGRGENLDDLDVVLDHESPSFESALEELHRLRESLKLVADFCEAQEKRIDDLKENCASLDTQLVLAKRREVSLVATNQAIQETVLEAKPCKDCMLFEEGIDKQRYLVQSALREYAPKKPGTRAIGPGRTSHDDVPLVEQFGSELRLLLSAFREHSSGLKQTVSKKKNELKEMEDTLKRHEEEYTEKERTLSTELKTLRKSERKWRSDVLAAEKGMSEQGEKSEEETKKLNILLTERQKSIDELQGRLRGQTNTVKKLEAQLQTFAGEKTTQHRVLEDSLSAVMSLTEEVESLKKENNVLQAQLLESGNQSLEHTVQTEILFSLVERFLVALWLSSQTVDGLVFQKMYLTTECRRLQQEVLSVDTVLEKHLPVDYSRNTAAGSFAHNRSKRRFKCVARVVLLCVQLARSVKGDETARAMGHFDVTLLSVLPSTVVKSLTDPTLRRPNLGFPSRESFFKKVDVLGDPLNLLERASECVLLSTRVGRPAAKPVSTLPSSLYHSALTGYYNSRRSSARVEGLESVLRGYQSRLDSLVAQVGEEVARKEALQDQVRQLEAAILGQEEGRRSIVEEIEVLEEKVRQRPAPAAVNELRKQLIEAYSTVQTEREARRQLENTISELRHESMESTQRQNALMNEIRSLHIEVRERNETSALDSKAANMELYDPFAVNIREEKKRPQGFASFLGKENY